MNTGEVIEEDRDLFGTAVNLAARVSGEAATEILMSDAVRPLIGASAGIELRERGDAELKGFDESVRLHEVVWREPGGRTILSANQRTPYVGREEERAFLLRLVDEARQGKGGVAVVSGEAGVGKTRLVQEVAEEAKARDVFVLVGHSYEGEASQPYLPYVEMMETAARVVPSDRFREALADDAPEVAKLIPRLRRTYDDIGPAAELPPEQERRFLLNALLEVLRRAAVIEPTLLIFEDLHWADDSTVALLAHFAQAVAEMPVLSVGTYRDVDLDAERPFARTLQELRRQDLVQRVSLARLPRDQLAAMLGARAGMEPPEQIVEVIARETEGLPLFVEEVFQYLADEGKLFDDEGDWLQVDIADTEVPEGVRLVIGQRLKRASDACQRLLTSAAVIGRTFEYEVVENLGEIDPSELLDALDEALALNLLRDLSDGREARYEFSHELTRQALLANLTLPRLQRLHVRIADAIAKFRESAFDEHVGEVASHLYQAGAAAEQGRTVRYLAAAAKQALEATAFEEALSLADRAIELGAAENRETAALHELGGATLPAAGRNSEAIEAMGKALDLFERLGEAEPVGLLGVELIRLLLWSQQWDAMDGVASRCLALTQESSAAPRALLLAETADASAHRLDFVASEGPMQEAMQLATQSGDAATIGHVLKAHGNREYISGSLPMAADEFLRSANLFAGSGTDWDRSEGWSLAVAALTESGRIEEARTTAPETLLLAQRLVRADFYHIAALSLINAEVLVSGDLGAFDRSHRELLDYAADHELMLQFWSQTHVGIGDFWAGHWHEARSNLVLGAAGEFAGITVGSCQAPLQVLDGLERDAASVVQRYRRFERFPAERGTFGNGSWNMLAGTVLGLAACGERKLAAELYPVTARAIDVRGEMSWTLAGLANKTAAVAAACDQRWTVARDHFETALGQAADLPHRVDQPDVRYWYARMLLDRDEPGDREKARELLTEAIDLYREIGMPKHLEWAEELLAGAEGWA